MKIETMTPDDPEFGARKSGAQRTREFRARQKVAGRKRTDKFLADGSRIHVSQFIAWDGEGVGADYTLLGWSDGHGNHGSISARSGGSLTTQEILDFVAAVDDRYDKAVHVIFAGGYDFNHWLRSLNRAQLGRVHRPKSVLKLKAYENVMVGTDYPVKLQVLMGKWFQFQRPNRRQVRVYDVWGFFQSSFVKACDDFITGKFGEDTWLERDMIKFMKEHREALDEFTPEQVEQYNLAELVNTVRLMNTLREQSSRVNLVPQKWHGPSAIAAKMLATAGIKDHMSQYVSDTDSSSEIPPAVRSAARYAYAGGRAEMLKYGDISGPVYSYDINSAYPAAMRELPSLVGGTWTHHRGDPQLKKLKPGEAGHFALYRVEWVQGNGNEKGIDFREYPGAFPYRRHQGTMVWPLLGEGWVWWPEFQAARDAGATRIKVLEAWTYDPPRHHSTQQIVRPFTFVQERYTERLELKARKDGGQIAIKLGLNSMYGRLAQQSGATMQKNKSTGVWSWKVPAHHQLEWAGWVTSWCRARVYEAAMQDPWSVVAFATDAVFTQDRLNLPLGKELGQWEETVWDEFCNIQSGFYFGVVDGKPVRKSRGVDKLLDVEGLIRTHWESKEVPMSRRGFYSLGLALSQDFTKWRQWVEVDKLVRIGATSKRKFIGSQDHRGMERSFGWMDFPCGHPECDGGGAGAVPVSHPHKVRWINDPRTSGMELITLMREAGNRDDEFNELDLTEFEVRPDE